MSVNKKEFVDRMAEAGGITKKEARRGFELFIETLMDCMCKDEKVMISEFGRFEMRTVKERKGRMPLGGEDCIVPEHRKMKFFVSREVTKRMRKIEGEYIDE